MQLLKWFFFKSCLWRHFFQHFFKIGTFCTKTLAFENRWKNMTFKSRMPQFWRITSARSQHLVTEPSSNHNTTVPPLCSCVYARLTCGSASSSQHWLLQGAEVVSIYFEGMCLALFFWFGFFSKHFFCCCLILFCFGEITNFPKLLLVLEISARCLD